MRTLKDDDDATGSDDAKARVAAFERGWKIIEAELERDRRVLNGLDRFLFDISKSRLFGARAVEQRQKLRPLLKNARDAIAHYEAVALQMHLTTRK